VAFDSAILAAMLRCLECGCSRFDAQGMACAVCGKAHGPRWERCYITEETQRTLLAHAETLQLFGVTLTEGTSLRKDAGSTIGAIALVLQIAESARARRLAEAHPVSAPTGAFPK
jgi:hypothetical protein